LIVDRGGSINGNRLKICFLDERIVLE